MDFSEVNRLFKEDLSRVEQAIRKNYQSEIPLIPGISGYLMDGGGKRIRPLLMLLVAKLHNRAIDDRVITHGCVVEYIHAATLLHDDVVDETTVRRGNETVNSKWGSDASILVGDFLISRGILLLAEDCDPKIIRAIALATRILVEGGILEFTEARNLDVSEEHCLDVIRRKTASILAVSCELGALLSNSSEAQRNAVVSFGYEFGMAFQLMDDAMDYDSDEDVLGKPPGMDFKEGHVTLPLLHLYMKAGRSLKKEIESFVKNPNLTQKEFDYVLERMREKKSIDYTLELAKDYMDRGKRHLRAAEFPCPEYIEALDAVADYTLERHIAARTCS
jgi:octaprenyl-diphosphate synthase